MFQSYSDQFIGVQSSQKEVLACEEYDSVTENLQFIKQYNTCNTNNITNTNIVYFYKHKYSQTEDSPFIFTHGEDCHNYAIMS